MLPLTQLTLLSLTRWRRARTRRKENVGKKEMTKVKGKWLLLRLSKQTRLGKKFAGFGRNKASSKDCPKKGKINILLAEEEKQTSEKVGNYCICQPTTYNQHSVEYWWDGHRLDEDHERYCLLYMLLNL